MYRFSRSLNSILKGGFGSDPLKFLPKIEPFQKRRLLYSFPSDNVELISTVGKKIRSVNMS